MASGSNSDGGRLPVFKLVPSTAPTLSRGSGQRVFGMLMSDRPVKNNDIQNVLKESWARYGPMRTTEVNESQLLFEFESPRDRDQIMDLAPWSVHGHCLNLRMCPAYMSVQEIDFGKVQVWVQIHGLSLEMFTRQNAQSIGDNIGKCLAVEDNQIMQQRIFLRIKVDIDSDEPLLPGFRWVDSRDQEKWASIRYERLSDLCYGCGRIGHSSTACTEPIRLDDRTDSPVYGPWTTATRHRANNRWINIGGAPKTMATREEGKRTWKQMMQAMQSTLSSGLQHSQGQGVNRTKTPLGQTESSSSKQISDRGKGVQTGTAMEISSSESESQRKLNSDNQEGEMQGSQPQTIIFDLNIEPPTEQLHDILDQEPCDLSLNLTLPVTADCMPKHDVPVSEPQKQREDTNLPPVTTEPSTEEDAGLVQSYASCPAALMVEGESTDGDGLGTQVETTKGLAPSVSHSSRVSKRRGDLSLDQNMDKRRRILPRKPTARKGDKAKGVESDRPRSANQLGKGKSAN